MSKKDFYCSKHHVNLIPHTLTVSLLTNTVIVRLNVSRSLANFIQRADLLNDNKVTLHRTQKRNFLMYTAQLHTRTPMYDQAYESLDRMKAHVRKMKVLQLQEEIALIEAGYRTFVIIKDDREDCPFPTFD